MPVNRRRSPGFAHLAVIGALTAAFALAGCGRKGPLDPPPSAAGPQPAQASQGIGINPMAAREAPAPPAAFDSEGRPIASKGAKKPLLMDWLID